jgi:hypothetical protein
MVRNMEFPCNLEVLGYLLGDAGGEFWTIVRLNGGWETEVEDNFLDRGDGNCGGPFS